MDSGKYVPPRSGGLIARVMRSVWRFEQQPLCLLLLLGLQATLTRTSLAIRSEHLDIFSESLYQAVSTCTQRVFAGAAFVPIRTAEWQESCR